uniref:Uncharacterized protein n=1 Tax=Arundo donax TaxID=35708 RepID=A0A0A8ZRR9_ARUDO
MVITSQFSKLIQLHFLPSFSDTSIVGIA